MKKLVLVWLIASLLSACSQTPLNKQTTSGKAEGIYPNHSPEQVIDALVQRCNEKGFVVEDQSKNYVVCSKEMQGGGAIFAQLMIGNSYSTTPQHKVRYSVSKFKTGTKVWADPWIETQMAFGQIQKAPLTNNNVINEIQNVLDNAIPAILNQK